MSSKREIELELQLWRERVDAAQMTVQTLNLQAQMLSMRTKECQDNIKRLEVELADACAVTTEEKEAAEAAIVASPAAGGGPGEER